MPMVGEDLAIEDPDRTRIFQFDSLPISDRIPIHKCLLHDLTGCYISKEQLIFTDHHNAVLLLVEDNLHVLLLHYCLALGKVKLETAQVGDPVPEHVHSHADHVDHEVFGYLLASIAIVVNSEGEVGKSESHWGQHVLCHYEVSVVD